MESNWTYQLNTLLLDKGISHDYQVIKLAGQASSREYFRLDFKNKDSIIIMKLPHGSSSISEEVTKTDFKLNELSFINIAKYLEGINLPIGEIIHYDQNQEILLLEDLGDQSFEKEFLSLDRKEGIKLYQQAIDLLIDWQNKTLKNPDQSCVVFHRKFDLDLLLWEINHFLEYGIEDYYQIKVDSKDKKIFEKLSLNICQEIYDSEYGLVHRDFQSRNLHLKNHQLYIIDFQDALLGPLVYDLVALLRDSYIVLELDEIDDLIEYYTKNLPSNHPYYNQEKKVKKLFKLVTLQRKLKDTGRFQFIHTVKNNPSFLAYRYPSLKYIFETIDSDEEFRELGNIIRKYIDW
jgi:hypothetical protein